MGADRPAHGKTKRPAATARTVNPGTLHAQSVREGRGARRTKFVHVGIILSLFSVFLAAALLVGGRAVIDPVLHAAARGVGGKGVADIVYALPDGEFCRHLSYDNATAELIESTVEKCGHDIAKVRARTAIGFAWGAH
jgi:hypothetical protein